MTSRKRSSGVGGGWVRSRCGVTSRKRSTICPTRFENSPAASDICWSADAGGGAAVASVGKVASKAAVARRGVGAMCVSEPLRDEVGLRDEIGLRDEVGLRDEIGLRDEVGKGGGVPLGVTPIQNVNSAD